MIKKTEEKILTKLPFLNEKQKRIYLATEAQSLGYGGIKKISRITGVSENTISAGIKEIADGIDPQDQRIRKNGGGRKTLVSSSKSLVTELIKLVETSTFGNPENPLSYTTKSLRELQRELISKGFTISHRVVGNILKDLGYSLQLNKKCLQVGKENPDRNAQFEYINYKSMIFTIEGNPVISVDTKKKELIGNFKNNGATYCKTKSPTLVLDHDFPIKELGKVNPYGVYDINKNVGFVNLGISKDTAEFAVESIVRWWNTLGKNTYPDAKKIYITCDGGGSNGSRVKLWKKQLQEFANLTGLTVCVSHFPAGTSKWNSIEHKMFCFISKNWRGTPLISVETTIKLISSTTTAKGLIIKCVMDDTTYELGKSVSAEDFDAINIERDEFHGEWNYSILPR